jgi:hypothetical protein
MSRHAAAYTGEVELRRARHGTNRSPGSPVAGYDTTPMVRIPVLDWPADLFADAPMLAAAA